MRKNIIIHGLLMIACVLIGGCFVPRAVLADTSQTCSSNALCSCQYDGGEYSKSTSITSGAACKTTCDNEYYQAPGLSTNGDYSKSTYVFSCNGTTLSSGKTDPTDTSDAPAVAASTTPLTSPLIPMLNVPIPGLDLSSSVAKSGTSIVSSTLAIYVNALYRYLIVAGAILVVVMVTIGGFQYMTAGGSKKGVTAGKERIRNALIGLLLLFGAYTMAFLVDPRLVAFQAISVQYIDPIQYVNDSGDAAGTAGSFSNPSGVTCNSSASLSTIAQSFQGNVTYDFGAKGTSTKCPAGQLCFDCSGWADYVGTCKGLQSVGGSSATIFGASAERVTSCTDTTINGAQLNPGDLLGWSSANPVIVDNAKNKTGEQNGHVMIYIGGGKIMDSHGPKLVYGAAIGQYPTTWAKSAG